MQTISYCGTAHYILFLQNFILFFSKIQKVYNQEKKIMSYLAQNNKICT